MNTNERNRRRFLKGSAAVAALAVGGMGSPAVQGQTVSSEKDLNPQDYGERSHFETSIRKAPYRNTPLQDSIGIITPSGLHYVNGNGSYSTPDIDPRQHRLLVHGLVDRPLIYTMEELKRLPSVSRTYFIECSGNTARQAQMTADSVQLSHGRTSCSEWTGVQLSLLLKEAGVQKGASWLVAEAGDAPKFSVSIPLEKSIDDVLVAYGQNGEAVRPENGYPLRLVNPGWEGTRGVKWLRRIEVVDQPYMTRWEAGEAPNHRPDGKSRWFEAEMGPKSVITFPSGGQQLPSRGFYNITGLAWSGAGAIRKVEVSVDGGRSWKEAQLQEPVLRFAHTRFHFPWRWEGEEVVIQSRCTDERGGVQPTLAEFCKAWGVSPDYWLSDNYRNVGLHQQIHHFNPIFPWRVAREGNVRNALFS